MKIRTAIILALLVALLPVAGHAADYTVRREDPQFHLTDLSAGVTEAEFEARYAQLEADLAAAPWQPLAILPVQSGWLQQRVPLQSGFGPGVEIYYTEIRYRLHYGADIMDWCYPGVSLVNLRPGCGTFNMTD